MAYKLALSDQFVSVHDVFHVSQLKKCLIVPHTIMEEFELELALDFTYEEKLEILEQRASNSSRYSGATILPKKQLGRKRTT